MQMHKMDLLKLVFQVEPVLIATHGLTVMDFILMNLILMILTEELITYQSLMLIIVHMTLVSPY